MAKRTDTDTVNLDFYRILTFFLQTSDSRLNDALGSTNVNILKIYILKYISEVI